VADRGGRSKVRKGQNASIAFLNTHCIRHSFESTLWTTFVPRATSHRRYQPPSNKSASAGVGVSYSICAKGSFVSKYSTESSLKSGAGGVEGVVWNYFFFDDFFRLGESAEEVEEEDDE
jgi:hypothetical protein